MGFQDMLSIVMLVVKDVIEVCHHIFTSIESPVVFLPAFIRCPASGAFPRRYPVVAVAYTALKQLLRHHDRLAACICIHSSGEGSQGTSGTARASGTGQAASSRTKCRPSLLQKAPRGCTLTDLRIPFTLSPVRVTVFLTSSEQYRQGSPVLGQGGFIMQSSE